jgi:TonB family protein
MHRLSLGLILFFTAGRALAQGETAVGPVIAVDAGVAPSPLDGGVQQLVPPRLVTFVEATYPREALDRGAEGDVVMDLDIDGTGHVADARMRTDPGYGMGAAAMDAVKQFVFTPAQIDGRIRAVTIEYTYRFRNQRPAHDADVTDAGVSTTATPQRDTAAPSGEADHHLVFESQVEAAGPTSAASSSTVRDRDLLLRPHSSPEDILRVVPGLVIAQHQGGGKADQLFLRGFDADHGTDVALFVDGAPVNMPSHGHGQGFADLHWLIPETIDRVDVTKGPYFAEYGDFDTAGAVNLHTRKTFGESSLAASSGSFKGYRIVGIAAPAMEEGLPWLAAAVEGTQGPFDTPEGLQRYNIFSKDTLKLNAQTELSIQGNAYGSQWVSSGQIPSRAVDAHLLNRFGSVDPTEGGQTQRQQVVVTLNQRRGPGESFDASAWAIRYRVRLFSDFTFQARDPVNSDEIEQNDTRLATGFNARYRKSFNLAGNRLVTTLGTQGRIDDIQNSLFHDKARARLGDCFDLGPNPCDDQHIVETNLAVYAEADYRVGRWLRVVAGVRGDLFEFNVDDNRPIEKQPTDGHTSGLVQSSIVNPKLQIVLRPQDWWDIYIDGGGGFHSNDARSVVAARGDGAVPRAWGGEVGTRFKLFDRLDFATAVWDLYLKSEQTFSADDDSTSPSDATNRYGVDFELRYEILSWLWADGDLTLAHAEFTQDHGNGNAVALAPTRTAAAGLTAIHPDGWKARIGMRHVGDRPATQDRSLTAQGYTLFDLSLGYRYRFVEVGLVAENLANVEWREAQFANDSRLANPPFNEPATVSDVHFTPGNPLNGRVTLTLFY